MKRVLIRNWIYVTQAGKDDARRPTGSECKCKFDLRPAVRLRNRVFSLLLNWSRSNEVAYLKKVLYEWSCRIMHSKRIEPRRSLPTSHRPCSFNEGNEKLRRGHRLYLPTEQLWWRNKRWVNRLDSSLRIRPSHRTADKFLRSCGMPELGARPIAAYLLPRRADKNVNGNGVKECTGWPSRVVPRTTDKSSLTLNRSFRS